LDKFAGVIGYDFISNFPLKIDYSNKDLIFYNPSSFIPPDSDLSVDFEFFMKIPAIKADYAGQAGKFIVDLGNSSGLILHGPFVNKYNLKETFSDIEEMKGGITGVGGTSETYAAIGGEFLLGPVKIESTPLMVAQSETGLVESTVIDGNIGNLLLEKFTIILDYLNKKIYILPPDE